MGFVYKIIFIALVAIGPVSLAQADPLTFGFHQNLCPIVCDPESEGQRGFVVDILNEIGEQKGSSVRVKQLPKARLVGSLNTGIVDFLLLPGSPIAKFKLQQTELPIVYFTMGVMRRRDFPFVFNGVNSLKDVIWGVENGQRWRPAYQAYIDKNPDDNVILMSGEKVYQRLAKMIAHKRIDVVIGQYDMLERIRQKSGLAENVVIDRTNVFGERVPLHLAFRGDDPQSPQLSRFFSDGIERLAKTGRLKEIFASYNVGEWAGIRLSDLQD